VGVPSKKERKRKRKTGKAQKFQPHGNNSQNFKHKIEMEIYIFSRLKMAAGERKRACGKEASLVEEEDSYTLLFPHQ
jgi:hypothetical protein